jgi:hypothetical protein
VHCTVEQDILTGAQLRGLTAPPIGPRLMMRGASLRSVGELLGHQSMKMTMRYAHV